MKRWAMLGLGCAVALIGAGWAWAHFRSWSWLPATVAVWILLVVVLATLTIGALSLLMLTLRALGRADEAVEQWFARLPRVTKDEARAAWDAVRAAVRVVKRDDDMKGWALVGLLWAVVLTVGLAVGLRWGEVGRYQFHVDGTAVYRLDTRTGEMRRFEVLGQRGNTRVICFADTTGLSPYETRTCP